MKGCFYWLICLGVFSQMVLAQPQIFINEILCSNVLNNADEYDEYDDWIELYNTGAQPVNLSGFYLTDNLSDLTKYRFPGGTNILPRGFLLIWADGQPSQGVFHANFKLGKTGEVLALVAPDGTTIIDSIRYPLQQPDISFGRFPDGASEWGYMLQPSPERPNNASSVGITMPPQITPPSGFYLNPVNVMIGNDSPPVKNYFTLNGSAPTEASFLYFKPVPLEQTTVFRGRAFQNGFAPGEITSRIFFINQSHELPILSIITDPENLFNDSTGIYVRYEETGREWERKVDVQFLEWGKLRFNLHAGLRIQGNSSVKMPKKSFRLFFREGYGQDSLAYPLFDSNAVSSFQNLVLRAGYDEDVSTPKGTLIRDPLITELWRRLGYLTSHSRFCVLYLNDDFWGIYDIRENINSDFIQDYLNYQNFDLIRYRWGTWEVDHGSRSEFQAMLDFFQNNEFSTDEMFRQAEQRINIVNHTDLHAFAHGTQYRSWHYGAFAIKEKNPLAKWHWTIWDMDRAYTDLNWNGFDYLHHSSGAYWNNFIVYKLLQNAQYRNYYINRLADLLNTLFKPENVLPILDSLTQSIEPEIPLEMARWDTSGIEKWYQNIDFLKTFVKERPAIVRQQMVDYFELEQAWQVILKVPGGGGKIKINTVELAEFPWSGTYFQGVPIEVTAIPEPDFQFVGWSDSQLPHKARVTIDLSDDYHLSAYFQNEGINQVEIITPVTMKPEEHLPIILRVRQSNGALNPWINQKVGIKLGEHHKDTYINLKKGAGSLVVPITATTDFSVEVQAIDFVSIPRRVSIEPNRPVTVYTGQLPAGEIRWGNESDRLIRGELIIPENCHLFVEPGCRILLEKDVNLMVEGHLTAKGTAQKPVLFIPTDWQQAWGGLEFRSTHARFEYCFFVNGGGDSTRGWAHTHRQPILFAKDNTDLALNNCFLLNAPGKAFGSIKSTVTISNCLTAFVFHGGEFHYTRLNYQNSHIMNIPNDDGIYHGDEDNDGVHVDYVYPGTNEYSLIHNCYFITGKDDAIDHHASRLSVTNCWLEDWMHEGVAASGADTIRVFNTVARACEQGIEAGWDAPNVLVDHCVVIDNDVGLRFGDSYDWSYSGHLAVTNTIVYNNQDNIKNYLNSTHAPYPGGIEIAFSMTNDADYDASPFCITGIPQFDEHYFLLPGSPGVGMGTNGTNMGKIDSLALATGVVVINEIMYKPASDWNTGDWIEVHNPQTTYQDISGWILKDDKAGHVFIIPAKTVLAPGGYHVICTDTANFKKYHPAIRNISGNVAFGFGEDDQVRLFAPNFQLVDSVAYGNQPPWPAAADGEGYSLELIQVSVNNALSQHWGASQKLGGTPGEANSLLDSSNDTRHSEPVTFALKQNYPNPFNSTTYIEYQLPGQLTVRLMIFNVLGQKVRTLVDAVQPPGTFRLQWNGESDRGEAVANGIYIYRLQANSTTRNFVLVKKLVLLK